MLRFSPIFIPLAHRWPQRHISGRCSRKNLRAPSKDSGRGGDGSTGNPGDSETQESLLVLILGRAASSLLVLALKAGVASSLVISKEPWVLLCVPLLSSGALNPQCLFQGLKGGSLCPSV